MQAIQKQILFVVSFREWNVDMVLSDDMDS